MSLRGEASLDQQLFNALVDPTRRMILEILAANGQMTASEIYRKFDMTNPAVSQHLRILRDADLVQLEKDAQKHIYSLNPKKMQDLEAWIQQTTELWRQRFDKLDRVLHAEKQRTRKRR